MTISNALIFIQRDQQENQLCQRLHAASNILELQKIFIIEQLEFSEQDFNQAFHLQLVKWQEVEEADQLKGFKMGPFYLGFFKHHRRNRLGSKYDYSNTRQNCIYRDGLEKMDQAGRSIS
jgi:hypothetical protein